jgi:hypothetical protein
MGTKAQDIAELKRQQTEVASARLTGAATVVVLNAPGYLLGVMFDADTVGLVTIKDGTTTIQIIPVGTAGGQMIPFFGLNHTTNITIVLAGADVGTAYFIPVA